MKGIGITVITATNDTAEPMAQHNEKKKDNNNGNEYSLSHFYDDLKKQ